MPWIAPPGSCSCCSPIDAVSADCDDDWRLGLCPNLGTFWALGSPWPRRRDFYTDKCSTKCRRQTSTVAIDLNERSMTTRTTKLYRSLPSTDNWSTRVSHYLAVLYDHCNTTKDFTSTLSRNRWKTSYITYRGLSFRRRLKSQVKSQIF